MTRKTLISFVVFAILLGITLLVALLPERREEIAWSIPALADTMDRVELVRQKQTIVIEKKDGKWVITQPKVYEVSASTLKGLTELVEKPIGMDFKVPVKAEELKQFEVDEEKGITVKIGVQGQEKVAFVVGKAVGNRTFLKPIAEDVVYRAKASLRWKLDKGLDDWREKKIVEVADQAKLTRLTVRQPDGVEVELTKQGDNWKIVKPVAADADGTTIGSLLSALGNLTAATFADDTPPEQAGFGPGQSFTITASTGEANAAPVGVEIGQVIGKDLFEGKHPEDFFVRRINDPQIFVARSYSVNNLRKKLTELKDRTVFALTSDQITGITLKTKEHEIVLEKEGDRWNAKQPVELVNQLDESQMNSLAGSFSSLRANELAPDGTTLEAAGLAGDLPESGRVELKTASGPKVLLIGKRIEGDDIRYHAKVADRDTIYLMAEFTVQRFLRGPSALRKAAGGQPPMPGGIPGLPPGMMMPGGMPMPEGMQ